MVLSMCNNSQASSAQCSKALQSAEWNTSSHQIGPPTEQTITLHDETEKKQELHIRHLDIFSSAKLFPKARLFLVRYVPLPCTAKSAKRPQTIMLTGAIRPTRNMPLCAERLRTHINKSVQSPRVRAFTWNETQNGETNYQATALHHVCHRSTSPRHTSSRQSQHSPAHKQCRKKHRKMASATACMQRPSKRKTNSQPMMASRVLAIFTSRNSFF